MWCLEMIMRAVDKFCEFLFTDWVWKDVGLEVDVIFIKVWDGHFKIAGLNTHLRVCGGESIEKCILSLLVEIVEKK